jgi:hypothetical protein
MLASSDRRSHISLSVSSSQLDSTPPVPSPFFPGTGQCQSCTVNRTVPGTAISNERWLAKAHGSVLAKRLLSRCDDDPRILSFAREDKGARGNWGRRSREGSVAHGQEGMEYYRGCGVGAAWYLRSALLDYLLRLCVLLTLHRRAEQSGEGLQSTYLLLLIYLPRRPLQLQLSLFF